jgi:hypothetical protein
MNTVAVSRQALETFEVRPTPATVGPGEMPDELMIDWTNVPAGQPVEIYLPAVSADGVLAQAARMYPVNRLTRVDANTIGLTTGGVSYVPLPAGSGNGANFAGLMSIALPDSVRRRTVYTVVVRQLTNASNVPAKQPPPNPATGKPTVPAVAVASTVGPKGAARHWRRVRGTFQINIPVSTKALLLEKEMLRLSIFRWIALSIPPQSRWHPVFARYLYLLAIRVSEMGGDPAHVKPSANGYDGLPSHRPTNGEREEREHARITGTIDALIYDRSGAFEGFVLDLFDGGDRRFESREREIEELVREAWKHRTAVTVIASHDRPKHPISILLRA